MSRGVAHQLGWGWHTSGEGGMSGGQHTSGGLACQWGWINSGTSVGDDLSVGMSRGHDVSVEEGSLWFLLGSCQEGGAFVGKVTDQSQCSDTAPKTQTGEKEQICIGTDSCSCE